MGQEADLRFVFYTVATLGLEQYSKIVRVAVLLSCCFWCFVLVVLVVGLRPNSDSGSGAGSARQDSRTPALPSGWSPGAVVRFPLAR